MNGPQKFPHHSHNRSESSSGSAELVHNIHEKALLVLEKDHQKLPDNILGIDQSIYHQLVEVCTTWTRDWEKNGIVKLILSVISPAIFFLGDSADKIRNMLHEGLILGQIWWNWIRLDKQWISLDAIAEIFLGIQKWQILFSDWIQSSHDALRARLRNLYPQDVYLNQAAWHFFLEHPGLIPYAEYITNKLFPFGIGRNCFIGAGWNGVVLMNKENKLAFKFYYDLQRKKYQTALKEWPSQTVFAKVIKKMHQQGICQQFSSPYIEVLAENHVEMELIEGETLDTLAKRFLLDSNGVVEQSKNLQGIDLDIKMREANLSISGYTIVEMLTLLYNREVADDFSYFLLELQERWLTHRDIDSSVYSEARTNVNPKNLMVRHGDSLSPSFVLIDFGNVTIENMNWHKNKDEYDKVCKNGYV